MIMNVFPVRVGCNDKRMPAKSLELKHTIKLIQELTSEINEIEDAIRKIMDELKPPILSIPGMGFYSAAMILAEVGDFSNFNSPDKVLAYAGCSPSTYQSGKLTNCYAHMEKRGSRYLRYALYTATKYVCYWNPVFTEYLTKKQAEGKHYNVAPVSYTHLDVYKRQVLYPSPASSATRSMDNFDFWTICPEVKSDLAP